MLMPVIFASSVSRSFLAFLIPSFAAARTRSSSIPLSSGLITSFSILMSTISSAPFTLIFTMPPPAAASTTRSLSSRSSFWSFFCMSSNALPYFPIPPAGNIAPSFRLFDAHDLRAAERLQDLLHPRVRGRVGRRGRPPRRPAGSSRPAAAVERDPQTDLPAEHGLEDGVDDPLVLGVLELLDVEVLELGGHDEADLL